MAQSVALFETRAAAHGKRIGFATLNAERSLNALSFEMADLLWQQFHAWREDPAIACVVLQGAGERAFCAGGDIVVLYKFLSQSDAQAARASVEQYFTREYRLDYLIHTFPKPVLCWGHGIVMGGGLGLMVGCSHRIVTEATHMAMPEITIGFYPDVAGSWFLNRMPGRVGLYLGLTGTRLNAGDALFLNLADYYVQSGDKQELYERLLQVEWTDEARANRRALSALLRTYRGKYIPPESPVRRRFDAINEVTDYDSVEEILAALTARAAGDHWLERGAQALRNGSPTSAKVIFEIYRRAARASLKEIFALELGLTVQFAMHPDLREGVRALLIDKDNRPSWSPARLEDVSASYVEEHFASPWPPNQHPFKDW